MQGRSGEKQAGGLYGAPPASRGSSRHLAPLSPPSIPLHIKRVKTGSKKILSSIEDGFYLNSRH